MNSPRLERCPGIVPAFWVAGYVPAQRYGQLASPLPVLYCCRGGLYSHSEYGKVLWLRSALVVWPRPLWWHVGMSAGVDVLGLGVEPGGGSRSGVVVVHLSPWCISECGATHWQEGFRTLLDSNGDSRGAA